MFCRGEAGVSGARNGAVGIPLSFRIVIKSLHILLLHIP